LWTASSGQGAEAAVGGCLGGVEPRAWSTGVSTDPQLHTERKRSRAPPLKLEASCAAATCSTDCPSGGWVWGDRVRVLRERISGLYTRVVDGLLVGQIISGLQW
jgi:hypothetical protein